ncbi:organic cation transporter protein-like isoform X1 [Branchiostoma floridae]|uniref:Organic cation transporter protein-like isoform X1 n=1 Tax=Branchiostoma floridae TaxID=7739 RepID=A0A9J7MV36_BRAFL|nr:organic cation transporter protein-like isoform X1 [Branchiostoma floridae]
MVDYDAALGYLGSMGKYQAVQVAMILVMIFPGNFHMLSMPFIGAQVSHHCEIPESQTAGLQPDDTCVLNYSLPWSYDQTTDTFSPGSCFRYDVGVYELGNLSCPMMRDATGNRTAKPCDAGWRYDRQQYKSSIFMEFDLVCENQALNNLAQAMYMLGVLIGSIGFGQLSDIIGRKKTMFLAIFVQVVFGVATIFAPNYAAFVIFRLIVGGGVLGAFLSGFVIVTELVGADKRTLVGTLLQGAFSAANMALAGIAYAIRDWRTLQLVVSVPNVAMLFFWWFVGESPRWLLSKDRDDEAEAIVRKAAKMNGVTIPEDVYKTKVQHTEKVPDEEKRYSAIDLVRTPNMAKMSLVVFLNWLVVTMVFYGLALNTSSLAGDDYLNFFISGAVDIPAYIIAIFSIEYFGRRKPHVSLMLIGGIACIITPFLAPPFLAQNLNALSITMSMIGKFGITAAFTIIYIWTVEMYPTVVRNVGIGASSMWARVGGIISPFVQLSDTAWGPLPYLIFGALSVVAGLAAMLLPETLGVRLPDTLEEGENFGKVTKVPPITNGSSVRTNEKEKEAHVNPAFSTKLEDREGRAGSVDSDTSYTAAMAVTQL